MAATQHDNNMVAAQKNGTNIGHRQQHIGQKGWGSNTSHKAATTVSKSVHDWDFELRDWDKRLAFLAGLIASEWNKCSFSLFTSIWCLMNMIQVWRGGRYSRCWAVLWGAGCVLRLPPGPWSCPSLRRSGPGSAWPPGHSDPSCLSPGPQPGSPTQTGNPPASTADHACSAPTPMGNT
jgi:hypothetical protein